jgi:hypothetical protein
LIARHFSASRHHNISDYSLSGLVDALLTQQMAKAVSSSLFLPSINSVFKKKLIEFDNTRQSPETLINAGTRFTKSLHVIEPSRTDLRKYLDFMEIDEEAHREIDDKSMAHFQKLASALGAQGYVTKGATDAIRDPSVMKTVDWQTPYLHIPLAVNSVNELVSHAIKGSINSRNPVDAEKVLLGLTYFCFSMPIYFISAAFDTPLGAYGILASAALAASGAKTMQEGFSSKGMSH